MTRSMLARFSTLLTLSAALAVGAAGSANARDTVVVRDHRTPNVVVRDHRTPNVIIRDHRTPSVVVRDHRGEAPVYTPVKYDPRYPTWGHRGSGYGGPEADRLRCLSVRCPDIRDHRGGR